MSTIFWAFVLRFGQAAIEASLTLLIGVVTAGVMRRMLTPAGTRKLFSKGVSGLARGWAAGMVLPVCSLGVIPVARELRRAGVPGGTVLSFVLAAPLLNPISFLYGLTLAEPKTIVTFAALSLLLSTGAGILWDRWFAGRTAVQEAEAAATSADLEPPPRLGIHRMIAVAVTAVRELTGRDLRFYLIGLTGTALLATIIPHGALQTSMAHSDRSSPLLMLGLSVPIFCSPLQGMMKIGLMFDHGNSIGAAFVLFALGIGTCLGTLAWLITDFGAKRILCWSAAYVIMVTSLGYAADAALYDMRQEEVGHTHAFDDLTSPFPSGTDGAAGLTASKLAEKWGPLERLSGYGLIIGIVLGVVVRRIDRHGGLERWLTQAPAGSLPRPRATWDLVVPGPVLGVLALIGLMLFSVIGVFIYYPDRDYCMTQIIDLNADADVAVRTGRAEEAVRYLEQWDLMIRKLEVGTYLRSLGVSAEQSESAEALREALEAVRDDLLASDREGAAEKFKTLVRPAFRTLKSAYPTE